ncbi:MAG: type II toxin-antitoxin system RatA family toxin [Gammaproteobacteria bacterium]|nr:type II toxin-antitoxin system RatA family toxin [Gammaproteobacteria bacterium]MCP5426094.1 type II toxin-antitoxin system RatA family toxin [Gammaproteobacteria bacterium]
MKLSKRIVLPYSQDQLYALVSDVERYAEFVPRWMGAKIRREGSNTYAEQIFGFGLLRYRFVSRITLSPPQSVHVSSNDGPFHRLELQWDVQPHDNNGCSLLLTTDFQLRSGVLQRMFDGLGFQDAEWLLDAFEKRAHWLYRDRDRDTKDQPSNDN